MRSLQKNSYILLQEKNFMQIEFLHFIWSCQTETQKSKFLESLKKSNFNQDLKEPLPSMKQEFSNKSSKFKKIKRENVDSQNFTELVQPDQRFMPDTVTDFIKTCKKQYSRNSGDFLRSNSDLDYKIVFKLNKLHNEFQIQNQIP